MTYQEFCNLIASNPPSSGWHFLVIPGETQQRLRCENDGHHFCPLTWIAKQRTGIILGIIDWAKAAGILGFDKSQTLEIAFAADGKTTDTPLRQMLIEATRPA